MPTKTDRILSYLPGTFRALPRPSALHAVVDAFGTELLLAENSLAAVMRAHWVDHADRGAERIDDLARIAALYGLAPRSDESVEEFREHLKRYIRTFLEGTVTVQGLLRVTAEALGLRIADTYDEMDTWWTRASDELITVEPRGDDAAKLVLGVTAVTATGSPARPAQVSGSVDLRSGVDLRQASTLHLQVDEAGPVEIDLTDGVEDPTSVTLGDIVEKITTATVAIATSKDDRYLTITSPQTGPSSHLEVRDVTNDAAELIFGLAPRTSHGSEAIGAQATGTVNLSGGVDLNAEHYLRLVIDGTHLAEIDLQADAADPEAATLKELRKAINGALDIDVASHDDRFLTLTSPTTGFASSIAFQRPAAQDATVRLFGSVAPFHTGRDAQPARVTGKRDLSGGVDLSERSNIQLRVDGAASVTINCAGADPASTRPAEIVFAVNTALGAEVASHTGRFVTLASPTIGSAGEIILEIPALGDATQDIFGIAPRRFSGTSATATRIIGTPDLNEEGVVDLGAQHFLSLAVDGGPPAEIDLRSGVDDPRAVSPGDLVDSMNRALEADIATEDGQHLVLTSPTTGSASRLTISPLETTRRRRFVTRAIVTDEAAQASFGFTTREEHGAPGMRAHVVGASDLSRGVDLREERFLRLAINGQPAADIDCAGRRPRATTVDEVVQKINEGLGENVAAHDGRHLVLTSPTVGSESRLAFSPPRAMDALEKLLDVEPGTFRGQDATRVTLVGTVDLSAGVDLDVNAAIKLGVNGAGPVEVSLAGPAPNHKTLNQIVIAITVALEATVASHDGTRIILTSPTSGATSRLEFAVPDGTDATTALFGVTAPRSYQGADPASAQIVGLSDLSGGTDLQLSRFLRLGVNGASPQDVDCAAQAANPAAATLEEIKEAINTALDSELASHDGTHLILTSLTAGVGGRITLEPHTSGDARQRLLGAVEGIVEGTQPAPAVITGEVDLLTPVDLSQRRLVRLSVDGDRPVDIDVAGAAPGATFLDEIVTAINGVLPDLAMATDDDRLRLTSPTTGESSRLALLPLRHLELIEYPPEPTQTAPRAVRHGDGWSVVNDGAAEVFVEAQLMAPQGVVGPTLVNATLGWHVRLLTVLASGETGWLWRDAKHGLRAVIISLDGETRPVQGSSILVGPLGAQTWVPFEGTWHLSGDDDNPATLQLNNPLAPGIVMLRARQPNVAGHKIAVTVVESELTTVSPEPGVADGSPTRLVGRIRVAEGVYRLVDTNEAVIAHLGAGPDVNLEAYRDRVVIVTGPLHVGGPLLMIVREIAHLFDVTLRFEPEDGEEDGEAVEEHYVRVTIGVGTTEPDSLVWQINRSPQSSQLVKTEELDKGTIFTLPRGKSDWLYLDCYGSRFDQASFDTASFAGGLCTDRGVFNVSRFANVPPEPVAAVFAPSGSLTDPAAELVFRWASHRPGAFIVNLPADLPARFGGRFNQARFGQGAEAPELYAGAVTEPPDDENFLVTLIKEGRPHDDPPIVPSALVTASVVPLVPLGWEAVQMPFRKPQFLTLGTADEAARLYLAEEGLEGFIELRAREVGTWGNEMAVTARQAGPAMYDVAVIYKDARFENARQVALGQPLPALTQELIQAGPIGVLQAKAAGVRADISRDRTETHC